MKTVHMCKECFPNSQQLSLWVLDYYDGPVSGVVTCPLCNQHFGFEMLDWTKDHRYRLFMLYTITSSNYKYIKKVAAAELEHKSIAGDQDYEQLKSLIIPNHQPDKLMIWDNTNSTAFITIDVPSLGVDVTWLPWLSSSSTTDWFALFGIKLPV